MSEIKIDLTAVIDSRETVLIGRENGENGLKKLKKLGYTFEDIEKKYLKVEIILPQFILSMNRSYFLGMFETAVERLGKDGFISKYSFATTTHIKNKISDHIDGW